MPPETKGEKQAKGLVGTALSPLPVVGPFLGAYGGQKLMEAGGMPGFGVEDPVEEQPEPQPVVGQETRQDQGGVRLGNPGDFQPFVDPKAQPGPAPFTLEGTIPAGVSPDVAAALGTRRDRINQAEVLTSLMEQRAMGVTEGAMREWHAISQIDAVEARRLHNTHFRRAREMIQELEQDVRDAKALKVNPNQWHQGVGRAGMTSAAFAAMVGGFAAGTQSPNSALATLEAAIQRDIASQETNIKNTFEALKMERGLLQDERDLYEEEMVSLAKTRALTYASLLGRIQLAKQQAHTEAHRLSMEVAEDRIEAKLLEELARVQQQIFQIRVNAPLRGSSQRLQTLLEQADRYKQMLQPGMAGGQTAALGPVTALDGTTAEDAMREIGQTRTTVPIQPVGRTAQMAARGPGGGPRPATPSVPRTSGEAPTSPGEQGVTGAPGGYEDEALGMSIPETQEQADARAVAEATREQIAQRVPRTRAEAYTKAGVTNVTMPELSPLLRGMGMPDNVIADGGYARAVAAQQTGQLKVRLPSISDGLNAVAKGQHISVDGRKVGGMAHPHDAEALSALVQPPDPALFPGGEDNTNFKFAQAAYEFGQTFPEIYEANTRIGEERNAVVAGGYTYLLRNVARGDQKRYDELREELNKANQLARDAHQVAKDIRRQGPGGIFDKDGNLQIPGITGNDPQSMFLMTNSIAQAMNFIKTHDPTARISDKDLEVGERAATAWKGGLNTFIDFVQKQFGLDLNKREQAANFLALMAIGAKKIMWANVENDIVPTYETMTTYQQEMQELDRFMGNYTLPAGR